MWNHTVWNIYDYEKIFHFNFKFYFYHRNNFAPVKLYCKKECMSLEFSYEINFNFPSFLSNVYDFFLKTDRQNSDLYKFGLLVKNVNLLN